MSFARRLPDQLRINLDMRPLSASPARTALPAAHFDRNERYAYFGDRTLLPRRSAASQPGVLSKNRRDSFFHNENFAFHLVFAHFGSQAA